jgi:ubiquinone/menaquinone biosynthesis C-methylase UbiE
LIGYEVSSGMLKKLRQKYPEARTYLAHANRLAELPDQSCDIIISTLVIGYIENLQEAFSEWNRVLKKGGEVLITDFHPDALLSGAKRSFKHDGQLFLIKNYVHTLAKIKTWSKKMNWETVNVLDKKIDETIKHFFEKHNSLDIYEKSFNTPILYGYHFQKLG